jgi:ketosteroid isomerase-like protein
MSEENAELARRAIDAFNRRDLDAFLALSDPEVEAFSPLAELDGGGAYRGHAGLRTWWESLLGISPDLHAELEEVRDLGDVMVTRVRLTGSGGQSAAPMDQTQWHVTRWRGGKSVWWQIFISEAEAIDAAQSLRD